MKPTRLLALAAALAGCAVAYGIHLFGKCESVVHSAVSSAKSKSGTGERNRSLIGSESVAPNSRRNRVETRRTASAPPAVAQAKLKRVGGSPAFSGGRILSETQWHENAARVEMEANHELNRLTGLLDLDPYQQDSVFSTFAQNSPHWLPGMQAGGAVSAGETNSAIAANRSSASEALRPVSSSLAGGTITNDGSTSKVENSDLTAFLNPEQQQKILQDAQDREEWWAEVLPQLTAPTVTGETVATATEETAAPETKEFDGGEILIEE